MALSVRAVRENPRARERRPSQPAAGLIAPYPYYPRNPRLNHFQLIEEVADLERGRLRPIRTMDRIAFDIRAELLPNRAYGGFGGIGSAHDFAQFLVVVIRFEDHHNPMILRHDGHH